MPALALRAAALEFRGGRVSFHCRTPRVGGSSLRGASPRAEQQNGNSDGAGSWAFVGGSNGSSPGKAGSADGGAGAAAASVAGNDAAVDEMLSIMAPAHQVSCAFRQMPSKLLASPVCGRVSIAGGPATSCNFWRHSGDSFLAVLWSAYAPATPVTQADK